jgi:methylthioribose-1-phosphate isomerase
MTPGPVLGEVAAHGISLAAATAAARDRSAASLEQRVRAAAGTLRAARRDVGALVAAVDRMEGRFDVLAARGATPDEIADGLAAEADAIALAAAAAHAQIGRLAATVLTHARSDGAPTGARTDAQLTRPLNVLLHGDSGPLTCGLVGMSTACFRALIDAGMDLHVWVTAGAPSNEGARITAYQLAQSDVPSTVIPDTAVGWLLANGPIDAVLLRGDAVARNGDVAALVGALQVAQMARTAGVPVLVLAARVSVEPELSDLRGLLPHTGVPVADIVPAALISSVVTEEPG